MTIDPDDSLTPDEAATFAALPRVIAPHDDLAEHRTVQLLRQEGLLGRAARRPRGVGRTVKTGGAVAAAMLVFAAGTLYGRALARRDTPLASPSVEVQQAGTAYVKALMRLSRASDTERRPGLQAGAATLRAAASSLAQVDPAAQIAYRIRSSLDLVTTMGADSHPTAGRSVIWF